MTTMMMSTPQMETQVLKDWKTIFPEFTTLEGSCLFIKKLIAVSLSSITYIRKIFPEEAYGERTVGGIKIKLLSEGTRYKSVNKFINLIRSCYDAVEKKYLQQLSVGICYNPENPDEVIEAYNLVFRYSDENCSVKFKNGTNIETPSSKDPTVLATFNMLKSIHTITEILGDLPERAFICVKLLYYDDVTPEDYEPQGFEPSSNTKFSFVGKTMNLKLGSIETDCHSYKFLLKTTVNKQSASQLQSEDPFSGSLIGNSQPTAQEIVADEVPDLPSSQAVSNKSKRLKCPCELKSIEDSDMITCLSCERAQHRSCYGFLTPDTVPPVFYCVECIVYNTDGHKPWDMVYTSKGKERKEFCAMRRALYCCISHHTFTVIQFEKLLGSTKAFAKVLLDRLESEGFIKKGSSKATKHRYMVDKSVLHDNGMPHYFTVKDSDENEENISEKDYNEMYTAPEEEEQNFSPERSPSPLETSITKVKALSLHNQSFERESTNSRKRKSSSRMISPNDSLNEVLQSPKKCKTSRLSRQRV